MVPAPLIVPSLISVPDSVSLVSTWIVPPAFVTFSLSSDALPSDIDVPRLVVAPTMLSATSPCSVAPPVSVSVLPPSTWTLLVDASP